MEIFKLETQNKKVIIGLAIAASIIGGTALYHIYQVYQATRPSPPQPTHHSAYTEAQLISLIRGTGARCKEPAIVTPTTIAGGTKYLIACYATTGTYEITITDTGPTIKTLKFK